MLGRGKGLLGNIFFILLGVGVGIAGSYVVSSAHDAKTEDCINKYKLTSQTLDCESYEDSSQRLRALGASFNSAVDQYIKEGKAKRISVWVRDLETKQFASVNEQERYAPASQLKVPLMIAYYKLADIEPTLLETPLIYKKSDQLNDSTQDFVSGTSLVEGQSYTIDYLITQMITQSDNNAAAALLGHLDPTLFDNTMIDLGIKIPGTMKNYDFLTAKTYATIFRTLYNASYLTREYSEKALELLANTTFKGMAAPLPTGTVVAHKFGEREVDNPDGSVQTRELHDCGVVYKGERPYSLCIMTEGSDFTQLLSIIKDLSTLTYNSI